MNLLHGGLGADRLHHDNRWCSCCRQTLCGTWCWQWQRLHCEKGMRVGGGQQKWSIFHLYIYMTKEGLLMSLTTIGVIPSSCTSIAGKWRTFCLDFLQLTTQDFRIVIVTNCWLNGQQRQFKPEGSEQTWIFMIATKTTLDNTSTAIWSNIIAIHTIKVDGGVGLSQTAFSLCSKSWY